MSSPSGQTLIIIIIVVIVIKTTVIAVINVVADATVSCNSEEETMKLLWLVIQVGLRADSPGCLYCCVDNVQLCETQIVIRV